MAQPLLNHHNSREGGKRAPSGEFFLIVLLKSALNSGMQSRHDLSVECNQNWKSRSHLDHGRFVDLQAIPFGGGVHKIYLGSCGSGVVCSVSRATMFR